MNIIYQKADKQLIVEITEEIDHHVAEKIRRKVDDEITRYMPRKTIFDFSKVTFMDSAGIGMLIGRYKMMKLIGGSLEIVNISQTVRRILEMSGINKIIPIVRHITARTKPIIIITPLLVFNTSITFNSFNYFTIV